MAESDTKDYKSYLAANVLSEDRVVTYRLLSRALKVHVNKAKQMLFEFHKQQNARKPSSVHAIYILAGTKKLKSSVPPTDADTVMQSSPPFASSPPPPTEEFVEDIPVSTITLVQEEHLDALRAEYDTITSIHIYSIGPQPLKDLQTLSDSTREIRLIDADRDLIEYAKIYGTIVNPNVERRAGRRAPPVSAPVQAERAVPPSVKQRQAEAKAEEMTKPTSSASTKPEPQQSTQSQAAKDFFAKDSKKPGKKVDAKPPPNLKRDSSSIFKSFAKAKPKLKQEDSGASAETSAVESAAPADAEDHPMKDVSDDEEDDYIVPASSTIVDGDRKSRKEREAALKRMMEDEDEAEEEEAEVVPVVAEQVEQPEAKVEQKTESTKPEEPVKTESGRRRGRRRVTKKKTMKDEEGYLVTKEELVWESFSEDEPAPVKAKANVASDTKKSAPAAKKNQGSIMSFFGKPKK